MSDVTVMGDSSRRAMPRLVGALFAIALLAVLWSWVWVLVLGLGQLFSSTQDGGCQQPEYVYGAALILTAIAGIATAGTGIRRAARVVFGRNRRGSYAGAVAVTVILAGGCLLTVTAFKPDFQIIPGAC